ncbi:hypothetical protein G9C98_007853 [Cotesia typhae]|uniref:Arrestin C-terminal-like domain-containing protein n=1 Tax=Cotesia typhae TaxID=2053667 RepID=A0A8J5QVY5_9HYME|nr:hypothetical protein G9C98_007853 [Cotesia typhae]
MKPTKNSKVDPVVEPVVNLMEDLAVNPAVDLAAGPVVNPAENFAEDLAAGPVINPEGDLPVPEYRFTTVYLTTSGKITLYAGKNNFAHNEKYIDGVVAFDPAYVGDRKVFVRLAALFQSGRYDLQSIGLSSEAIVNQVIQQIYPPLENQTPLTALQKKMMDNLKEKYLFPYNIQWPENFPSAVILQSSGDDEDDDDDYPCGVLHEIRAYIGEKLDKIQYPDFTLMEIQKVIYESAVPGEQPRIERDLSFLPFEGTFHIECTLDKKIYYHGETIAVNIHISNNTKHTVRKIGGFKIEPGANLSRTFELTPLRSENRKKKSGLAIDGSIKSLDTNLAPTTV